jgi:hypothetical protein
MLAALLAYSRAASLFHESRAIGNSHGISSSAIQPIEGRPALVRKSLQDSLTSVNLVIGEGDDIHDAPGVKLRSMTSTRLGAWLGFAALCVQIFLPIHLVLDIVEAAAASDAARPGVYHVQKHTHPYGFVHTAANLASPSGPAKGQPTSQHSHCPICSIQMHAAAAFTLPSNVQPPSLALDGATVTHIPAGRELTSASAAFYASRAPPPPSIS